MCEYLDTPSPLKLQDQDVSVLIFSLDGVLVRAEGSLPEAYAQFAKQLRLPECNTAAFFADMQAGKRAQISHAEVILALWPECGAMERAQFLDSIGNWELSHLQVAPGASGFLQWLLHQQVSVALTTSGTEGLYIQKLRRAMIPCSMFSAVAHGDTSHAEATTNPLSPIFERFVGVPRRKFLFVGNTLRDFATAKRAEIGFAAIVEDRAAESFLRADLPRDRLFPSLMSLKTRLLSQHE